MNRLANIERLTSETAINIFLNLDGSGQSEITTGIGFFDHMLILFSKHGFFDLNIKAAGDLEVDGHHTVEDTGIVLGQAFKAALGDKAKIRRYGTAWVPMDEALAMTVLDISGRPFLVFEAEFPAEKIGQFDSELTGEFFRAFCVHAGITAHIKLLAGKNTHHMIEAVFKSFGRALAEAVRHDERIDGVMSTKGTLN